MNRFILPAEPGRALEGAAAEAWVKNMVETLRLLRAAYELSGEKSAERTAQFDKVGQQLAAIEARVARAKAARMILEAPNN